MPPTRLCGLACAEAARARLVCAEGAHAHPIATTHAPRAGRAGGAARQAGKQCASLVRHKNYKMGPVELISLLGLLPRLIVMTRAFKRVCNIIGKKPKP